MNNIDKEIEEFKTNLTLIEKVSKEVVDNNNNFSKIIEDCQNLEEIKNQLNNEITNLNKTNKEYALAINNIYNKIIEKNEDVLKQINSQNQEIEKLKEHVNILDVNNNKFQKIIIVLLVVIILLCLISFF